MMTNRSIHNRQLAFSLIELVIVIVLIGVLSVSFTKILNSSVSSYIDAKDRNEYSQSAKWVTEIISRSAREALPQSVRTGVSGDLDCIEYMQVKNATSYFNLPANGLVNNFNTIAFDVSFETGLVAAIMPVNPTSIYVGNGVISAVASITSSGAQQNLVTLSSATNFSQRSPQNRVFFLTTPITICLNNNSGLLTRYFNYGFSPNLQYPPSGGNSEILAHNFWANGTVFNYQSGSLQRSGLLQLNFVVQNRDRYAAGVSEEFEVFHEVHIRNVP